jgi:ferritin-like metal-binding protein YciE
VKTHDELFQHFLKDMYYAERAILKSLPELIGAAQSEKLRA